MSSIRWPRCYVSIFLASYIYTYARNIPLWRFIAGIEGTAGMKSSLQTSGLLLFQKLNQLSFMGFPL